MLERRKRAGAGGLRQPGRRVPPPARAGRRPPCAPAARRLPLWPPPPRRPAGRAPRLHRRAAHCARCQARRHAAPNHRRPNATARTVRFVEREEASRLAGWPVAMGGWWFPGGGWIDPPSLCRANLAGIDVRYGAGVTGMDRVGALWRLRDAEGRLIAEAPTVVLANGIDAPRLLPQFAPTLPVRIGRGSGIASAGRCRARVQHRRHAQRLRHPRH